MSSSGASTVAAIGDTVTKGFQVIDPADSSTEWAFLRAAGFTRITIDGNAASPAILALGAPNGVDYADFTFDGNNTEIDASIGNISLRPLAGGNVNVWAFSGTPKLRVGSTNFAQSLDVSHDGVNSHTNNTNAAGYIGFAGDLVRILPTGALDYSGPTDVAATAGTNGAPPAQVGGYIRWQIAGTTVRIPYYF